MEKSVIFLAMMVVTACCAEVPDGDKDPGIFGLMVTPPSLQPKADKNASSWKLVASFKKYIADFTKDPFGFKKLINASRAYCPRRVQQQASIDRNQLNKNWLYWQSRFPNAASPEKCEEAWEAAAAETDDENNELRLLPPMMRRPCKRIVEEFRARFGSKFIRDLRLNEMAEILQEARRQVEQLKVETNRDFKRSGTWHYLGSDVMKSALSKLESSDYEFFSTSVLTPENRKYSDTLDAQAFAIKIAEYGIRKQSIYISTLRRHRIVD